MRCQLAHLIDVGGLVPGANPASFMPSIICIRNGDLRVFLGLNGILGYEERRFSSPTSVGKLRSPRSVAGVGARDSVSRVWHCQNPSKAAISASARPASDGCRIIAFADLTKLGYSAHSVSDWDDVAGTR
jgi:hypothetical protein